MLWLCLWRLRWRWLRRAADGGWGWPSPALHRPPDLLVSADARLIGFARRWRAVAAAAIGRLGLTRDTWLRAPGHEPTHAPCPRDGEAAGGAIACRPGACTLRAAPDGPVAVLLRGDAPRRRLRAARRWWSRPSRCAGAAPAARWSTASRSGATARMRCGSTPAGARVVTDRAVRGERPWVPPVPQPRGGASREPPSATE